MKKPLFYIILLIVSGAIAAIVWQRKWDANEGENALRPNLNLPSNHEPSLPPARSARQAARGNVAAGEELPTVNDQQISEIDLKTPSTTADSNRFIKKVGDTTKFAGDHLTIFTEGTPITPPNTAESPHEAERERLLLKVEPEASGGAVKFKYKF